MHRCIQIRFGPWASPVVLVKKKDDDTYRFCVDYRKLNLVTAQDAHPLPPSAALSTPEISCSSASPQQSNLPVFVQSIDHGPVFVTVESSISLPSSTESVIQAKVPKGCADLVGLVCSLGESNDLSCFSAYTVNKAAGRKIIVRMLNPSQSEVELHAGQKIARFWPVSESVAEPQCSSSVVSSLCASLPEPLVLDAQTRSELETALSPNLSTTDRQKLLNTLIYFPDVFNDGVGHTSVLSHHINTGNSAPIRQHPRRLAYHYRGEVDQQVKDMLQQGVVQPSASPWASPVVLVKKKDGTCRICVDYRKLNLVTAQDAHPLPRVDDLLDSLNGNSLFSTLDLRSGYWQLSMSPEDQQKTAFVTPHGLFEFLRMPHGLCTAPATFARAIGIILSGLTYDICLCYFDDVIIFSKTIEQHCHRLETVLQRFRAHGLKVKASKCSFGANEVIYLGHSVSSTGIHTDPSKTKAVQNLPSPTNLEQLRSFLGLAGYYRKFIPTLQP